MYQCTCRRCQRTWMALKEAVAASLLSCLDLPMLRMMVQAGRQRTTLVNCKQSRKHLLSKKGIHVHIKCTCRRRQRTWMGLKEVVSRAYVALQEVWVELQMWVDLLGWWVGLQHWPACSHRSLRTNLKNIIFIALLFEKL